MRKWISREEESELPDFNSFEEAWMFFVKKYDKDMMLESVDIIGDEKCYFCTLVIDWDSYKEMLRLFESGEAAVGMRFVMCKQPIQIFENGKIHIVH